MALAPSKKSQDTYNIDDVIGMKSTKKDISSSEASWRNLDWSEPEMEQPLGSLTPEQVNKTFEPIIQAVKESKTDKELKDRIYSWVTELFNEAMKGPDLNKDLINNNIGNLYFFCEDIFQALYQAFIKPDSHLDPAFKLAAERYHKD